MTQKKKFQFHLPKIEEGHVLFIHSEKLNKITNEINQETDRGAALFSASILDQALQDILAKFFVDSAVSNKLFKYPDPLSSFSARQNMCLALGLISVIEYEECNTIRSIRNNFAHNAAYSIDFNHEKIDKLCKTFRAREPTSSVIGNRFDLNRVVFIITVSTLLCRWTERLDFASTNKRQPLLEDGLGPR